MKKVVYIMLFLAIVFVTRADLVDDFEDYTLGDIEGQGGWTYEVADSALGTVASEAGNQFVVFGDDSGDWRNLHKPTGVPVSTLSTLFFRINVQAETAIDHAFGLTDDEAIDWYDDLASYVRVTDDTAAAAGVVSLDVRDGGGFVDDIATLTVGQWYNVWLVIDPTNASGTFDVYCTEDGVSATGTPAVYTEAGFRKAYADPLDNFVLYSGTGTGTQNVRVDDAYVINGEYLGIPITGFPYDPSVEEGTPVGSDIPATLKWKAAGDPDGVYEVNPKIVDQYIFISGGKGSDPNMYYLDNTGEDPGLTDPNSQYSFTSQIDGIYWWAIVDANDGYAHDGISRKALTVGVSTLDDVDPNNIIGPTWLYEAKKSVPTLTVQPVDTRVFTSDPNAQFTVQYTSAINEVTVTWYKDDVPLEDGVGDVSVETDPFAYSTLTIDTPTLADEGTYYAILSVQAGTDDDIQSASRLLVIKQLLAQYTFDNADDRLEDTGDIGAEPGKSPAQGKSVAGLAEPNEVLANDVDLAYVTGIEGDAVYLDGEQYIDLDPNGYPKAGPLDTLGDIRGGGYEKQGFGRGMDEGSILCWVKLESDGVVTSNANIADGTHYAVTTNGTDSARIIVRGENWDGGWQNLGEANGAYQMDEFDLQDGQWHMLAATWNNSTARIYINGEQVATSTQGYTEVYVPWDLSNLVGVGRSGQPDRHILNVNDFVTGSIDSLRIYNYVISADEIALEYINLSGNTPCINQSFDGSDFNFINTASSYCIVDLEDFAEFAKAWLTDGLYE